MGRNKDLKRDRAKKRGDMPKQRAIFNHWRKKLFENHNREIYTQLTCFACLREGYVQRCHIEPLHLGGSNKAENLHLLCPNCHVESEEYLGPLYWIWFENKDIVFMPFRRDIERGELVFKIAQLMKEQMPKKYKALADCDDIEKMKALYYQYIGMAKADIEPLNNSQSTLF